MVLASFVSLRDLSLNYWNYNQRSKLKLFTIKNNCLIIYIYILIVNKIWITDSTLVPWHQRCPPPYWRWHQQSIHPSLNSIHQPENIITIAKQHSTTKKSLAQYQNFMVKHMLECNPKSKSKSKFKIQETKININKANMNGLVVKSLSNMHKVLHAHLIATDILKKKY